MEQAPAPCEQFIGRRGGRRGALKPGLAVKSEGRRPKTEDRKKAEIRNPTKQFRALVQPAMSSKAMTCSGVILAKQSALPSLAQGGSFTFAQAHGAN
jgi:hypothetical protein